MASLEVDAQDVIRVILQFCRENNLSQSFAALSAECQVSLNTVDNVEAFSADIAAGRWDTVLPQVAQLQLPRRKLEELYEHIFLELCELSELDTARTLLRQSAVLSALKLSEPDRYLRLEHLLVEPRVAWPDAVARDARRHALAASLVAEVSVVPAGRLLALLGQALKWQRHTGQLSPGGSFELLRGSVEARRVEPEACVAAEAKSIRFGKKSHAQSACFSPDGQFLITGSSDGFVEVWDASSGKLRTDLPFQQQEAFMMHDNAVLAASISRDSELLATGSADGVLKVWQLQTGACVRRFGAAHAASVTSCAFSRDGTHVLTGSCDATARVHGLKSGKLLKELRGHSSFVSCAAYSADDAAILTAGVDGTLRLWESRTGEAGAVIRLPPSAADAAPQPLLAVVPLPGDCALVCPRGNAIYVVALTAAAGGIGCVLRALPHGRGPAAPRDFVAAAVSARGGFAYGICADGALCCFDLASDAANGPSRTVAAHAGDGLGVVCHAQRSLVATFGGDGTLKLWKP